MNPPPNNGPQGAPPKNETRDRRRVMKLAILCATGSVGRELVAQALAAGHEVTALVRAQPTPSDIDDRVALVLGDATSADAVSVSSTPAICSSAAAPAFRTASSSSASSPTSATPA